MASGGDNEYIAQRVLRLTDIAKEPTDFLMPISGYEDMPIVSLEKAVEPLVSVLPAVKSYAYAAKKRCKNPADNLTPDESAAIMLYSMGWEPLDKCLYCALNTTLRSKNRANLRPWFLFLRLFLSALFHLPPIPRTTVFRGVKLDLSKQFKKGETFVWWGFSSCTTSVDILQSEQFLGTEGTRTMFAIQCDSARDIRKHSYYPSEDEVLLLAATEFEVKGSLDQGHGLRTIQLQEIQSDEPLLMPVSSKSGAVDSTVDQLKILEVNDDATDSKNRIDQPAAVEATSNLKSKAAVGGKASTAWVPMRGSLRAIPLNAKWSKTGITVAGGNGQGDGLNQLSNPTGLFVDDDQTVHVADCSNHRIMEWKLGAKNGTVLAGGYGRGTGDYLLDNPFDVMVDRETDCLIIADLCNQRVIRWPHRSEKREETLVSGVACVRLTMDEQGSLYVVDSRKHEVKRYKKGDTQGKVIIGGNGGGTGLHQLQNPYGVFVDRNHSIYVCEYGNHRVTKWPEGAKEGMLVAGGQGAGNADTQLNSPLAAIVDQLGTVYVADQGNHRVVRWLPEAKQGIVIIGGNGYGNYATQLNGPWSLSFDRHGNLYVADYKNHRVQRFDLQ